MHLYLSLEPFLAGVKGEGTDWFATAFKLTVLLVCAPAWIPVLKELWKEVNESLAEDGGVFGETPDEQTARSIGRARVRDERSLVSVLMADRRKAERAGKRGNKDTRGTQASGISRSPPRKRTF